MADPTFKFTVHARAYVGLIEETRAQGSWIFSRKCLRSILRLYEAASCLPETEPSGDLSRHVSHEEWKTIRTSISTKLYRDSYWKVFEPLEDPPDEVIGGTLSDDLGGIWRDIKTGLLIMDEGNDRVADAVWHWRFSFETHWGRHAVGAIAALHALCYGPFGDPGRG